ncbi:carboxy terminal-processing peptidase [Solitalea sp. MAHUQ-68]|uniref:Carboxy terminal-processing peptidase n=1 Tax=Solitalea agri TaxID=2953739 RepID=A0A9X2F141_9SPHI|nr:carboxy terminal-processing peptidase [Solitalea agri]MCO4292757.1 carboxy terminal-processing peptidase [Solitalea agri]
MIRKLMLDAVALSFLVTSCSATPSHLTTDVGSGKFNLQPEPKHFTVAKVITGAIEEYHYKKVKLDDSLSSQIFSKYLKDLDGSRSTLLASDVKDFSQFKYSIDDQLEGGDLTAGYYIYNRYADRLSQRVDYALSLLKGKMNLDSTDSYELDREKEQWFATTTDLNNYWNKRVRYELISQKLISKDEQKAYDVIKKRYENLKATLEKLKSEDVFETYMNAFSSTVEPHTVYLSPKSSADFKIDMSRALEGIGATLRSEDGYTKIVQLSKGGPAEKSKQVQPNDRIIAVAQGKDGEFEDVVGWRIDDVVGKIRGSKGTIVRLQIIPAGADVNSTPKTVVLVRDKVVLSDQQAQSEIKTVNYNGKVYKIGVISVPAFYIDWDAMRKKDPNYTSTSRDVKNALIKFKSQGVDGVVMDLRNNGGGSLKEAIELTGLFIKTGPVVQVREANGNVSVNEDNDPDITYAGPLTVLVNRFSASASEIFSAAMQDYQRGLIIGEQTYGKGTVQTAAAINELINKPDNLGQLNLTVAKFYRISGGSTQHKGVIPDVTFPSMFPADKFGESSEPTALPWDQIKPATYFKVGNLVSLKPSLVADHEKRMVASPEYKYLLEDIKEFETNESRKDVVLNINQLKKERDQKEEEDLARYNERRKAQGQKPVAKGADKTPLNNDYVKDESLQVTAELIGKTSSNTIVEAAPKKF